MTPIHAQLIGSNSCSALGTTVSAGDPIRALCRRLVADGWDPEVPMKIWKGEKPWRWVRAIGQPNQMRFQQRRKA